MFYTKSLYTLDVVPLVNNRHEKKEIFGLLIGHRYFYTECKYHAAKKQIFCFLDRGQFFQTFRL